MTYDRIYFDCSGSVVHDKRHAILGRTLFEMPAYKNKLRTFSGEVCWITNPDFKTIPRSGWGQGTDLGKVIQHMRSTDLPIFAKVLIITDDTRYLSSASMSVTEVEEALSHPDVTMMDIEDCYEALGLETLKSKALKLEKERSDPWLTGYGFGVPGTFVPPFKQPATLFKADRPEWEELFKNLPKGWTRNGNNTAQNAYGDPWHITKVMSLATLRSAAG